MRKRRFPRIQVTGEIRLVERILHHTYNKLAKAKDISKAGNRKVYDIYRTKQGKHAPIVFLMLAQTLVAKDIDPSLYLKVLCQYGRYSNSSFMPHPTWLGSKKAMETFLWLHKKDRKRYERHTDWKGHLDVRKLGPKHIRKEIRSDGKRIKETRKNFNLDYLPAVLMLFTELSSWYLGAAMLLASRKIRESLWYALESLPKDSRKKVTGVARYLVNNESLGKWIARKTGKYFR